MTGIKKGDPKAIYRALTKEYPDVKCELDFKTPYQLLVATVLSAQCTDKRVNEVTPNLFKKYPNPEKMSAASQRDIERLIKSAGFFRTKAKNIKGLSKKIMEEHNGKVPKNLEELIKLPGVGRKTANVVLNAAFNKPTIAVDTHVFRVSNRTGLTNGKNPEQVEKQLIKILPTKHLKKAHHLILLHGRYTCKARNPLCKTCIINKICLYKEKNE